MQHPLPEGHLSLGTPYTVRVNGAPKEEVVKIAQCSPEVIRLVRRIRGIASAGGLTAADQHPSQGPLRFVDNARNIPSACSITKIALKDAMQPYDGEGSATS